MTDSFLEPFTGALTEPDIYQQNTIGGRIAKLINNYNRRMIGAINHSRQSADPLYTILAPPPPNSIASSATLSGTASSHSDSSTMPQPILFDRIFSAHDHLMTVDTLDSQQYPAKRDSLENHIISGGGGAPLADEDCPEHQIELRKARGLHKQSAVLHHGFFTANFRENNCEMILVDSATGEFRSTASMGGNDWVDVGDPWASPDPTARRFGGDDWEKGSDSDE